VRILAGSAEFGSLFWPLPLGCERDIDGKRCLSGGKAADQGKDRRTSGMADAAVSTVPNVLGIEEIYALIQAPLPADDGALRAHCQLSLPRSFVPVRFKAVNVIPRNEMGKIQREGLLETARSKLN
jgi:acyl-CoA synthetase (AMP-forming)/AMP-acid ligase II